MSLSRRSLLQALGLPSALGLPAILPSDPSQPAGVDGGAVISQFFDASDVITQIRPENAVVVMWIPTDATQTRPTNALPTDVVMVVA